MAWNNLSVEGRLLIVNEQDFNLLMLHNQKPHYHNKRISTGKIKREIVFCKMKIYHKKFT